MSSISFLPNATTTARAARLIHRRATASARAGAAAGFSLVELMVAMTIGLLIIVGLTTLYVTSVSGKKTDARFAEFQTNARFGLDAIKRDIQMAGFASFSNTVTSGLTTTAISTCDAGFATRLKEPIFGYNDSKGTNCSPSGDYEPGTDVLVLRRIGPECIGAPPCIGGGIATDRLYVRSTTDNQAQMYVGNAPPLAGGKFPEEFELHNDIYFIRQCTNATCESPNVPALYRMSLKPGPVMEAELVASNIEDMQLQYGVNTVNNKNVVTSVQFQNAKTMKADDWKNVASIRIWLLARSSDKDPGFSASQTFSYADKAPFTKSDGYQRQLFQQVVQIREVRS